MGAVRLLVDNHNGVLLSKSKVASIAHGIDHILSLDAATLKAMQQTSLTRARLFSWDCIAKRTLDAIEHITAA